MASHLGGSASERAVLQICRQGGGARLGSCFTPYKGLGPPSLPEAVSRLSAFPVDRYDAVPFV